MAGIEHRDVSEDEAGMRLDRWFKVHYPGLGFARCRSCSVPARSASMAAG